jgi:hypothetical protein
MQTHQRNGQAKNGTRPRAVSTASDGAATPAPGRAADGKFAKGNRIAVGNAHAREQARLRGLLLASVGADGVRRVALALIRLLEQGNLDAGKVLLRYCIGPPLPGVDPDCLDSDELSKVAAGARAADVLDVGTISPAVGTVLVKLMQRLALQLTASSPAGQLVGTAAWDKVFAELNDPELQEWWQELTELQRAEARAGGKAGTK